MTFESNNKLQDILAVVEKQTSLLPQYENELRELKSSIVTEEEKEKNDVKSLRTIIDTMMADIGNRFQPDDLVTLVAAISLKSGEDAVENVLSICAGKYALPGEDPGALSSSMSDMFMHMRVLHVF